MRQILKLPKFQRRLTTSAGFRDRSDLQLVYTTCWETWGEVLKNKVTKGRLLICPPIPKTHQRNQLMRKQPPPLLCQCSKKKCLVCVSNHSQLTFVSLQMPKLVVANVLRTGLKVGTQDEHVNRVIMEHHPAPLIYR